MEGLHFDITGDNSNLLRKLEESRNGVRSTSKQIEDSGMSIEQMFGRMTTAAAAFGVSLGAKQLVSDITRVRGEFQQLEVAFNTMLGSKEQADTLMSQLVKTAAITPFDLQGVANGAKQLLAYGTAAEDVNGTLVRLGDIAAGLSIPLNDLVWLYGTTMTQGRLFTQDLRQFQGRGIPLADELAKQFGVAKDKVGELVTAGKIGFPEVQKAIESMTNEGGKFGGLMEAQSKTITGRISNIEDAIATMFNQIGKENESIINGALSGASYLVEYWQEVAIAIESAAIAYGTYKAAVMTTAALQGAEQTLKVDAEIEGLRSLLVVKEESKNADIAAAVASGRLKESKAAELTMLREELALKISSLEAQNTLAEKEYVNALLNATTAEKRLQAAQDAVDGMDDWIARAEDLGNTELANTYRTQLAEKSTELQSAAIARNSAQKALNDAATKKKTTSEALNTVTVQANTVANHANTASMNIMKLAAIQLTAILKGMWATLMANPLFLVIGAFAGLAFAIYKVATAETEAEKATRLYNEAIDEQQKKQDEYKEKIDALIKTIDDSTKSEGERLQAFEALKSEYPTVLNNLLTEAEYLKDILKYKKLIAEEDNNRAKKSDAEILEEAKSKLEYYQRVRKNGTSTSLVDIDGNGWATDNVDDAIKAQQEIVNKAIAKVASHDVTSFLGNIKDMKNEDIVSVIDGINNSLKALGKSGDNAIAIVAELGGEFSKQQLSTIKNALETEQKSRSTEKNTGKEWSEKYKNAYLIAKKELDDFLNTNNSLTEIEYERKLKELTDKKDEAEKKYRSVGGVTGSSLSKQENQAKKEAEKQKKEQQKSAEQLLSLRHKNQQDEISLMEDGTEKKLSQIAADFEAQKQAIEKNAKELAKTNKEAGITDVNKNGLTTDQQSEIDKANKLNIDSRKKAESELYKAEVDAMRDYLKEYGTFQQQKLAIAEEYADKIEKATTKGERLSLEKQRDSAIQQVDIKALEQKIDWQAVFGDISGILGSQLKETLEGLKEYVKTDKFNSSSETDKQIVYDAIDRLSEVTPGGEGTLNFSKIKAQMDSLGASMSKYQAATIAQTLAQDNLKKATDNYNNALKGGSSEQIENAKIGLSMAQNAAKIADDAYNSAASDVRNLGEEYKSTSADTIDGLNLVAAGFQGFANKSLPSIFSGLQNTLTGLSKLNIGGAVGDAIGKLSQTLSSAGVIGQIISAILSILDILKDGIGPLISGIIDSILGAINGILDNILSGDMFVQIFSSIKNGIGNILNTITFGGFNSWFGIGGNKKEVEAAIDRLTDRNETLQTAIEDLTDVMEASKGTKSVTAYTDAKKLQKETEENYKKIAQEQARYSNSHHSWNYYWDGFNQEEIARLSSQIGRNWNGDIWSLSPEEMKMLRSNVDMWEKIQNTGKGNYGGRLTEKLNDYINQAGKMEELTNKLYEGLTGISFESMYDSFIDTLMDMDASAEDAADNIAEYFMRAMLSNKIGELYSEKLEAWWNKFGKSMEDNELTKTEREDLQDEYMQYVEEAMKIRDEIAAVTGYTSSTSSSQESTKKGFAAASQDSIEELNGRFTALQIAGEEIKNAMLSMLSVANILSVSVNNNSITLIEIKNLMITSNSYLEDILGYTKKILDGFSIKLDSINKNIEKAI